MFNKHAVKFIGMFLQFCNNLRQSSESGLIVSKGIVQLNKLQTPHIFMNYVLYSIIVIVIIYKTKVVFSLEAWELNTSLFPDGTPIV